MSLTNEFRKNPTNALKTYSKIIVPMKNFLDEQIKKLNLQVDIEQLYPINEVWSYYCSDNINTINRRKKKEQKKTAFDRDIKRPSTPFFIFLNKEREEYIKAHPESSFIEVVKELSKKWKILTDVDKELYNKLYQEDRQRYLKEREEALEKFNVEKEEKEELEGTSHIKKPQRALNPYIYFIKDVEMSKRVNAEFEKMIASGTNIRKNAVNKIVWDSLTKEEKKKYEDLNQLDKDRYEREMVEYKAKANTNTSV